MNMALNRTLANKELMSNLLVAQTIKIELRHVEVRPQMDSELNRKVLNDENAKKSLPFMGGIIYILPCLIQDHIR